MALSNYERQKKWREKNRALYNLQRRNRRKNLGSDISVRDKVTDVVQSPPPVQTSKKETLEKLRGLIKVEQKKPVVEVPVAAVAKFGTYRDDSGRPITERAWRALEKLKERAEKGGYVYDEFSQA